MMGQMFSTVNRRSKKQGRRGQKEKEEGEGGREAYPFHSFVRSIGQTKAPQEASS